MQSGVQGIQLLMLNLYSRVVYHRQRGGGGLIIRTGVVDGIRHLMARAIQSAGLMVLGVLLVSFSCTE
jgi:hypothetical protein